MDQNFSSFQNYQPGEDQEIPFVQIKNASYFRAKARTALKGKWLNASVMAFLYQLIAGAAAIVGVVVMMVGMMPAMLATAGNEELLLSSTLVAMVISYAIMIAGSIFLGAPLTIGYCRMSLEIHDGKDVSIESLFYYFKHHYFKTVKVYLLFFLVIFAVCIPATVVSVVLGALASLIHPALAAILALIVAVIAAVIAMSFFYRYSMSFFILAEYPEMRAIDVLRSSANMMKGRKWKLFCLHFSFMGLALLLGLLGSCTCGVVTMVAPYPLMAYFMVANAAFYDDAANREAAREAEFPSLDPDDYSVDGEAAAEEKNDEE
jgi:uncharacterized membrane protein